MIIVNYAKEENKALAWQVFNSLSDTNPASVVKQVDLPEMTTLEKTDMGQDVFDLIVNIVISQTVTFSIKELFNFLKGLIENRRKGSMRINVNENEYIQDLDLDKMTLKDIQKLEHQMEQQKKKLIGS